MKNLVNLFLIVIIGFSATSCKEDVGPTLIVNVVDTKGAPQENRTVLSHPCYFDSSTCINARLNETYLKQTQTNSRGQVTFEYPESCVLNIVVIDVTKDNTTGDTMHSRLGSNVVALETKELKKGEKNEYETTVVLDVFR